MLAVFLIVIFFLPFPQQDLFWAALHNMSLLGLVALASNLALRRQRQEDRHQLKASLVYGASWGSLGYKIRPCFKNKQAKLLSLCVAIQAGFCNCPQILSFYPYVYPLQSGGLVISCPVASCATCTELCFFNIHWLTMHSFGRLIKPVFLSKIWFLAV